jgi:hypothetical protein
MRCALSREACDVYLLTSNKQPRLFQTGETSLSLLLVLKPKMMSWGVNVHLASIIMLPAMNGSKAKFIDLSRHFK